MKLTMFEWYRELSGKERKTFWACFFGWATDAMDAQMFAFVLPAIIATWSLSKSQAGLIATGTFLATAVGGWIAGVLADRYGRVRILKVTIVWFAFFALLCGLAQSYPQLVVLRVLQGIGFGGEWAAGAVLMGEIIRPQHRGKAVGCVQAGYGIGFTAATLVATVSLLLLPQEWAWRAVFFLGALPALLVIYINRYIEDPDVYIKTRNAAVAAGDRTNIFAIFNPKVLRITALSSLLAFGVIGAGSAINPWLPTYMRTVRHFSDGASGGFLLLVTTGAFFGFIGSAYLTDAIGRRRNFQIFSVCCWIVTLLYLYLPLNDVAILALSFPLGFFVNGAYAALGPYFTELFPTSIRGAGQAFAYNAGKGFGAFTATAVGLLADHVMQLDKAIGLVSLFCYVLAIIATLLLPETRGATLTVGAGVLAKEGPEDNAVAAPAIELK